MHSPVSPLVPLPQALLCAALFALAFAVAPHSCNGGLDVYVWSGLAVLVLLAVLPFVLKPPAGGGRRGLRALLHVGIGFGVWVAGGALAEVRIMCRLF